MLLNFDIDHGLVTQSLGCTSPLQSAQAQRGDGEAVKIRLIRDGSAYEAPGTAQIALAAKKYILHDGLKTPDFASAALAMADPTAFVYNATTGLYECPINYAVADIDALLGLGTPPEALSVTLACQAGYRPTSAVSWERSQWFPLVLNNAVWRGDETVPGGDPTEPGGPWLRAAIVNIKTAVVNNNAVANTLQDITGLKFPVEAGKTYTFRFQIPYTSASTANGCRFTINGPAATQLNFLTRYPTATTTDTFHYLGDYDLPALAATAGSPLKGLAIIEGVVTVDEDGDIIARFASETADTAITALPGANVSYAELNMD